MRPRRRHRGLTLIEVLLALGLIALIASMMFLFYDRTMRTRDAITRHITDMNLARVVAEKIADEVRSANGFLLNGGPGVSGKLRQLRLQTVVLPEKELFIRRNIQDQPLPARSDIRQVQYYLAYDPDVNYVFADGTSGPAPMGLVRREIRTLNQVIVREDQAQSVELDLFAPELKYFRLRYFDGVEWVDRWQVGDQGGMGNSLPQAVEITVGYDALPPELDEEDEQLEFDAQFAPSLPEPYSDRTYTVLVKLPQADVFFGSRMMRAQQLPASDSEASSGGAGS